MKNFIILYWYELKKLVKRKLCWGAVIVLTAFCAYGVIRSSTYSRNLTVPMIDENGNETGENLYISGEEIYNTYRQTEGNLNGRVMDDEFFREMQENIPDL